MKTRFVSLSLLLWLAACAAPTPTPAPTPTIVTPLFVYADASLTNVLRELRGEFVPLHPEARVELTFVDGAELTARLDSSFSASLAVSADPNVFRVLANQNRLEGESRIFARDPLAIIIARTNPKGVLKLQDLNRSGLRVAIASQQTVLGQRSRLMLENLNRVPHFRANFLEQFLEGLVAEPATGVEILNLVERHRADVGVVYASEALIEQNRVFVLEQPPETVVAVEYSVGMLKANRDPARLQPFIDFMLSPRARTILGNHGLQPAR